VHVQLMQLMHTLQHSASFIIKEQFALPILKLGYLL